MLVLCSGAVRRVLHVRTALEETPRAKSPASGLGPVAPRGSWPSASRDAAPALLTPAEASPQAFAGALGSLGVRTSLSATGAASLRNPTSSSPSSTPLTAAAAICSPFAATSPTWRESRASASTSASAIALHEIEGRCRTPMHIDSRFMPFVSAGSCTSTREEVTQRGHASGGAEDTRPCVSLGWDVRPIDRNRS